MESARMLRQHQPVVPFVEYLTEGPDSKHCLNIQCSAVLTNENFSGVNAEVCRTNYSQTYWTYQQLIAHQTINGSMIGTGDLLGTGTMSMHNVGQPRHSQIAL